MSFESIIGRILRPIRPGPSKLVSSRGEFQHLRESLIISSPAFACGTAMSPRFTSIDKEISPPLQWSNIPPHTKSLLLIVEDADPPLPRPLVHAIAYNISPSTHTLAEGEMPAHHDRKQAQQPSSFLMGKNSMGGQAWKGPRPVAGHGPHHYYFQLFALTTKLDFKKAPEKKDILKAINGNVLAVGTCIGTFERP
jgi:Raf kinase inhibitor-like YbhB/YbcL family protein